jgi:hypothetical protein
MKKLLSIILLINCLSFQATAQKEIKYKKIFYKNQTIENADVKVTIEDAVATPVGLKFKITIQNKTNDYILFKPTECEFKVKGNAMKPSEKPLLLKPNSKDDVVLDIKGGKNMVPEDFEFYMAGFYKISMNAQTVPVPDFKLPASSNDFKAGNFSVSMEKSKKETALSWAKFKVTYNGDKIGIIEPPKVAMKMPDGKEYANYHSDDKPLIMEKGAVEDFTPGWKDIPIASGDMQLVELTIMFRDTFKEVTPVKIPGLNLSILFDKETSYAKGR